MLKFSTYSAGLRQWCILKVSEPEVHRCGEFALAYFLEPVYPKTDLFTNGVSTQLQSSGLVAHENSTFRNLALAVFGPSMA